MLNMYITARTNYFKVSDLEGLKAAIKPFGYAPAANTKNPELYCVLGDIQNGWDNFIDHDTGRHCDIEPFEIETHVMPYVTEGEVVVAMEIGNDKLQYITGQATAYTRQKETILQVNVSLSDIYALAAQRFNKPVETIALAQDT